MASKAPGLPGAWTRTTVSPRSSSTKTPAHTGPSRGLAGGSDEKKPAEGEKPAEGAKKEEPKKSGGLLGKFKPSSGSQAQQSQTVASAGARGVNPDRDAVGGPNKKRVPVKIGPNDIAEFQKGIA